MNHREEGRRRGREAAAQAKLRDLPREMEREFAANLALFPTLGTDYDFGSAVLDHDWRRLHCTPDVTKFPELKYKGDEAIGEREGFVEASGFEPVHAAYFYSFGHLVWKHINSHHVARYDLVGARQECTNVFFPHGREGITCADNRDDVLYPHMAESVMNYRPRVPGPNDKLNWIYGGVSSAVLLDEEPEQIFPHNPHASLPPECRREIKHIIGWMDERKDFWGPGNQIWVDDDLHAVTVEKTNRRAAYRDARVNGAVCITAGSYLDPELNEFKLRRLREVARRIGETEESCMDIIFAKGCDARYRRLVELTDAEAARPGGATLWGAFEIVSDTAVPYPDRICLAGEKFDPAREPNANWTISQHAGVVSGPWRRIVHRTLDSYFNPRPITEITPRLLLGEGVLMQPEWEVDIRLGKCVSPPD